MNYLMRAYSAGDITATCCETDGTYVVETVNSNEFHLHLVDNMEGLVRVECRISVKCGNGSRYRDYFCRSYSIPDIRDSFVLFLSQEIHTLIFGVKNNVINPKDANIAKLLDNSINNAIASGIVTMISLSN